MLPGAGRFPIAPLLAALRADDFAGPVSLEVFFTDLDPQTVTVEVPAGGVAKLVSMCRIPPRSKRF
mgnify:CR=1 FL=1